MGSELDPKNEQARPVKYDMAGSEALTAAIRRLLNGFPGLEAGETISFATLRETGGMAMFPGGGPVVEEERRSVTGRVRQVCRYPFAALYRRAGISEAERVRVKERLDDLGRWLGRQSVVIDGKEYRLEGYPELSSGRKLLDFSFTSPAYLYAQDDHQTETWAVELAARYENIYQQN